MATAQENIVWSEGREAKVNIGFFGREINESKTVVDTVYNSDPKAESSVTEARPLLRSVNKSSSAILKPLLFWGLPLIEMHILESYRSDDFNNVQGVLKWSTQHAQDKVLLKEYKVVTWQT